VVPKYNPARTFTPEGAVGLGGTYLCIYPMDSPGGAQAHARLQHPPAAALMLLSCCPPATLLLLRHYACKCVKRQHQRRLAREAA